MYNTYIGNNIAMDIQTIDVDDCSTILDGLEGTDPDFTSCGRPTPQMIQHYCEMSINETFDEHSPDCFNNDMGVDFNNDNSIHMDHLGHTKGVCDTGTV